MVSVVEGEVKKPPTSHKDSLVLHSQGRRKKKAPTSHKDSLVLVVAGVVQ